MKRIALFSLILAVVLTLAVTTTKASASKQDFEDIEIFQAFTGVAFLDKDNGRIYIYDSTLEHCVEIRQLSNLGEPIILLEKPAKRHF